jgi:hypothetical protein
VGGYCWNTHRKILVVIMSYIAEWRAKLRKAQEAERERDRKKRGVKLIIIKGAKREKT